MSFDRLRKMVLEQFGDDEYWKESAAEDIASHGADGGWSGFTYYSDTVPFGEKIRSVVKPILQNYADEFGEDGIYSMMHNWRYLKDYSVDEIAEGWASNENEDAHTAVMNSIAWFALEEVARRDSEEGYQDNPSARKPSLKKGAASKRTAVSRKTNPRPRIGAKTPNRKSERTGEKPSKRLVQRRKANTRKGYYPNPKERAASETDLMRVKARFFVQVRAKETDEWASVALFTQRAHAEEFAKRMAARLPKFQIRLIEE